MKASNEMLNAYIECALWSSVDDNGEPLDGLGFDVSADCRKRMAADCASFLKLAGSDVAEFGERWTYSQIGHDFWLSRNGHGAGFFDRGEEDCCERLQALAETFGTCDLYVSDNNEIEVM